MREFMQALLERSISAGWLVLAVVVLRLLLRRAPKWTAPLLWGLVGVRLVMPFSVESAWSLIPRRNFGGRVPTPAIPAPQAVPWSPSEVPGHPVTQMGTSVYALQNSWAIFSVVWAIGAVVMLSAALVSVICLCRRLRTAVRLEENLYETEQPGAPFVMGLFRPRIYLPFGLPETERHYVLLHERAHLRRGDPWWKALAYVLLAVYWFHPLMWLAYVLLGRDLELACDERAVRELSMQARADYSQSLLRCSVPRHYLAVCPLAFGEAGVRTRVKYVLNSHKPAFYVVLAAVIVCILTAVCFLTDPPYPRAVLAGGRLYYETELTFDGLPDGAVEIGVLKSTTRGGRELPGEELCGANLDEDYPGCELYRCPDAPDTLYLKKTDGTVLAFRAEEESPVGDLLETICSSPVEASSTAAYMQAHQAEYDRLVALDQETLAYCFREFLADRDLGLRGAVMECACQEIMVSWGMKQEDVQCPYGGAEDWFYLMAHCASMARLECTPQELKETFPAWYLLLEAAEGKVRDLTPYHVNRALYEENDLPADFPLDALCVYAVYSDGACAESVGVELYRRFMQAPEETLEHIATLLDWNIPCRGTAASNVVSLLTFDAQYFDTVEAGKTPFRDLLKRLRTAYPDGGEAQVLDLLEEDMKRMEGLA